MNLVVDLLPNTFIDPLTGDLIIPVLNYDRNIMNPFSYRLELIDNDPVYKMKVIDHVYTRLTEKWLYQDPDFKKLIKYFQVEHSGDKGTVTLIKNMNAISTKSFSPTEEKYILSYIEKYFITNKMVSKVLSSYVSQHRINWYDIFTSSDGVKYAIYKKLKKLIIATITHVSEK